MKLTSHDISSFMASIFTETAPLLSGVADSGSDVNELITFTAQVPLEFVIYLFGIINGVFQ